MSAVINDIMDSMSAKIQAIVPAVDSGVRFRPDAGTMPPDGIFADRAADRSFRITSTGMFPVYPWGGTAGLWEELVSVHVLYLSAQKDEALRRRINSDKEQITKALHPGGVWPTQHCESWPQPTVSEPVSLGSNRWRYQQDYRVQYEVT